MIRFDDSQYKVPTERGKFFPFFFGAATVNISDELCEVCKYDTRFRVYVFLIDKPKGNERPFYGGLIFIECARCGTMFVTRLPKPSEQ